MGTVIGFFQWGNLLGLLFSPSADAERGLIFLWTLLLPLAGLATGLVLLAVKRKREWALPALVFGEVLILGQAEMLPRSSLWSRFSPGPEYVWQYGDCLGTGLQAVPDVLLRGGKLLLVWLLLTASLGVAALGVMLAQMRGDQRWYALSIVGLALWLPWMGLMLFALGQTVVGLFFWPD